jgi:hypothetical protein
MTSHRRVLNSHLLVVPILNFINPVHTLGFLQPELGMHFSTLPTVSTFHDLINLIEFGCDYKS